jgi:hypothetical protein
VPNGVFEGISVGADQMATAFGTDRGREGSFMADESSLAVQDQGMAARDHRALGQIELKRSLEAGAGSGGLVEMRECDTHAPPGVRVIRIALDAGFVLAQLIGPGGACLRLVARGGGQC